MVGDPTSPVNMPDTILECRPSRRQPTSSQTRRRIDDHLHRWSHFGGHHRRCRMSRRCIPMRSGRTPIVGSPSSNRINAPPYGSCINVNRIRHHCRGTEAVSSICPCCAASPTEVSSAWLRTLGAFHPGHQLSRRLLDSHCTIQSTSAE